MFDQLVTFIYTKDLERSCAFYANVLELPLVLDQRTCRIFQISSNGFVGICTSRKGRPSVSDGVIITLVTQDVDGWHEKLAAKGVAIETPPANNPEFNIRHCFLRDPDGYQIEIQCFKDPMWPSPA